MELSEYTFETLRKDEEFIEVGRGTGLGLSLVYAIVTDLGGAIDVETAPDAGSVFAVYLPHAGDRPDGPADGPPAMPGEDARVPAASLAHALPTEGRP